MMEGGSAGTAEKAAGGGTCCCGCSLRCAIVTFGVMAIIGFFINLIVFAIVCLFMLAAMAVDTISGGMSIDTFRIILIIVGVIGFILVSFPAVIYIMFFCDETKPRLNRLPMAHICICIFNVLVAVISFIWYQTPNGINQLVQLLFNIYFYMVAVRYVKNNQDN